MLYVVYKLKGYKEPIFSPFHCCDFGGSTCYISFKLDKVYDIWKDMSGEEYANLRESILKCEDLFIDIGEDWLSAPNTKPWQIL